MEQNKMGVMPVGKLLFTMSIPMIISMLVQALYNIVDSIFVAMVSENALTAVSLAFPIQNLMIALGVGTGVGVSALVSRFLGAKQFDKANSYATHGVWLALITTVVFMIIIALITKPFYTSLTDDPEIFQYSVDYTMIVGIVCVGIFMALMFEKLLQATGRTGLSMVTQLCGAITNIVLDPILIFGVVGEPLGVRGAAVATVAGQIVSAILGLIFCLKFNKDVHLKFKGFRFSGAAVKEIYKIGVPSIILSGVGSIMTFVFNMLLMSFSSTAAAVFGAYFKLQSFIFMPIFGLNNGLIPIIAYNYGAKRPDRMKRVLNIAYITAIIAMLVGLFLFEVIPGPLLSLFSASENMLAIGIPALRIIGIHFLLAGFCIMSSSYFQALGSAHYAMIMSIMRQLAVLVPAAYILATTFGLGAIWWSFPIAEVVSLVVCLICKRHLDNKVLRPLEAEMKGSQA